MTSQETAKGPRLLRNDRIWDSMKEDIRRIYLTENETLAITMTRIEGIHGFSASSRKWKMKLEGWKFEKKSTKKRLAEKSDREATVSCADGQTPQTNTMARKRQKLVNGRKEPSLGLELHNAAQGFCLQSRLADGGHEATGELGATVTGRPALALIREELHQGNLFDLDSGPANAENLSVLDTANVTSFSEDIIRDSSISPSPLPNAVWEDSAACQLPRRMYPTQRQHSPTTINVFGVSTQSPTFGSCAWSGFDSDADSFSNMSLDIFPRISSNTNVAAPVEQEILLDINSGCGLFHRLPWFQLLELIERPGSTHADLSSVGIFDKPEDSSNSLADPSNEPNTVQSQLALSERHTIVSKFFKSDLNNNVESPTSDLTAHLKQFIPEQASGDLHKKSQQLLDLSNNLPAVQIFQFVLFFSSNNLLSEEQSDAFLKWVIDQKYTELLIGFFKHESPTLRAFAPRILEGAVRIVEPELVRRLLACSIDTHVLSGLNGGRLLRALCNTMWEASMADRDDYQHLLELVNILLNNGADPQKSNDSDDLAFGYPLYTAVFCNNIELAGLLVKAGADINHESDDPETGSTPIAFAIYRGQPAMVTFLLESGAKLRNSNVSGIPVLAWAATERPRIYQILRSHALGPPDKIDVPGIIYASRKGDSGLSDYLRGAGKRDETELTELLERALHTVVLCYSETLTPLEALLDIGVNANVPTQMENPPLVSALQNRMYDVAELLLSRGADPNAPGVLEECTSNFDALELVINHGADATKAAGRVLCIAALSHSLECIALLIESGADVNSRGHGLWSAPTPLQYLALYFNLGDSVKTATLLIGYGADVNAPASLRNGYTALQGAAREANLPLLRYYLDIGADVNAAPAKTGGMTALEASARNNGHKDKPTIFHLLVQAGAKLNRAGEESKSQATTSTLHALIETGSTDLACFAINAGADIDLKTCGKEGRTPLQRAAERGNLDIVKLLLQKGAKVNAPAANNFGRTALQAAAFCETPCMALVKLLLEHGAAINAKPAIVGGVTALQASAIRGYLPITLLLLESGADVNAKAAIKDGRTAIEGAAEHGRLDTVQLLINAGAIGDVGTGVQKAIDAAERNCHFAVADMLKEHQKTLDLFPVV